mmetsp:Transcript_19100/g.31309  ORF Transcript_19100/g.31309 Transcript_19100/m.31309 type:complete len:116 (-) Transcript_19100:424-771(-)
MSYFLSQECLRAFFHLSEDHTGYLLGRELLRCPLPVHVVNLYYGFATVIPGDFVGHEFFIRLNSGVGNLSSDESLDIKDGICGVLRCLVLGGISDETSATVFGLECHVGGCDSIA